MGPNPGGHRLSSAAMKTALLFFLLGLAAGAIGMGLYAERHPSNLSPTEKARAAASNAADRTESAAANARDTFQEKLQDWHLTGDDIKADLAKTGQVVREKSARVGGAISDARILSVIKAKYLLDRDISTFDINVDVSAGEVLLQGHVTSVDLIGKAVGLALDTDGVRNVRSKLIVSAD